MERNVGRVDAGIRLTLAAICFGIAIALNPHPVISLAAALAALLLVGTALTKSCPLYRAIGTRTNHSESDPEAPVSERK